MSKSETPRTDVIHELRKDRENLSQYFYMVNHARQLERELAAAREEITILKSKYAAHHAEAERLTSEIRSVTEQRDRLAEALEQILEYQGRFAEEDPESIAREALQSLITNETSAAAGGERKDHE
jgi:chromosome segregation ATPase